MPAFLKIVIYLFDFREPAFNTGKCRSSLSTKVLHQFAKLSHIHPAIGKPFIDLSKHDFKLRSFIHTFVENDSEFLFEPFRILGDLTEQLSKSTACNTAIDHIIVQDGEACGDKIEIGSGDLRNG